MNQGTAVVDCKREHEFQDKRYGAHKRVANATQKGDEKNVDVRCTVCKTVHRVNKSRVK